MTTNLAARAALLALLATVGAGQAGCSSDAKGADTIRPPVVADKFYPGTPAQLRGAVEQYLQTALPPLGPRPLALVAPHAGYVFSGQIAADAYRQAQPHAYDVVVILGTCHTVGGFTGMSVYQAEGFRTPLGVAAIDTEVAAALLAADRAITGAPEVHAREHSVEVQVPFVQVAFPGVRIVACVVGAVDPATATRLGRALAATLRDRCPLLVASSDLSHYPRAQDAARIDLAVLDAIAGMQPEAIAAQIETQMRQAPPGLSTCACGEGAVMVAVSAAAALGAARGTVVSYAHSGDTVFGEDDRVVGYGAVACTAAEPATPAAELLASGLAARAVLPPAAPAARAAGGPEPAALSGPGPKELDQADRDYLLRLARGTVTQFLQTGTVPLPRSSSVALQRPRGVFVTLNELGQLRGCIGHMAEDTPLQLATARMALEAALRDPRFRPVGADELSQIEVEISVLTPFVRVSGPERFVVGRDGVVLEKSGHRAVYLPQVAPEQGWTRAETLAHLCEKAGLAVDCWQEGATLSTFQAQVFAEASGR